MTQPVPVEQGVSEGDYLAVLFDPTRGWGSHLATLAAKYPHWISIPCAPEHRQAVLFGLVTDSRHLAWEVWRGGELCGILLLTDIAPLVDARLHIAFFDHNLVGKTRLLRRFLRYCFTELRFQRITAMVPAFVLPLAKYYRQKLGFRFEGEPGLDSAAMAVLGRRSDPLASRGSTSPEIWIASVGSRRERAHWDHVEQRWADVLCLRLLAPEFASQHPEPSCPLPLSSPLLPGSPLPS